MATADTKAVRGAADDASVIYSDLMTTKHQALWGEGYLSPGGEQEVDAIISGIDVFGRTVLDVGCGVGGPSCRLAEAGAARVTAYDVEAPVLSHARRLVASRGLGSRIELFEGAPGPLPFADASFDIVFSKDALIHVKDKAAFYAEAMRVLKPGGWFAASDWYGETGARSPDMERYLSDLDMGFRMQTLSEAEAAVEAAGFERISARDRSDWYAAQTREEVVKAVAEEGAVASLVGADEAAQWLARVRLRAVVVEQGQLRPGHLRGRKPV